MSLLPTASAISIIHTSKKYAPFVACVKSGQAWVRTDQRRLQLIERQGPVKRIVDTDFNIRDIATSVQGDFLISDYDGKFIKTLSENGEILTLFCTQWSPWGLCCLQNGDVMVAFYIDCRVIQYRSDGKVVRELDRSLFRYPRSVGQNRVNNHIYVCEKGSYGGKVLAVDEATGKLLYEYTGSDANSFIPVDACTDQAGHIIITNCSDAKIHILDQDGRFLQYMMTKDQGLYRPFFIDTDFDGYAWVCEWERKKRGEVKIVRYTS